MYKSWLQISLSFVVLIVTKWETCKGRLLFFTLGLEFAPTSFHSGIWVCPYIFSLWDLSLPIHLFTLGFEFARTSFHSGIWVCPYIFSLWDLNTSFHSEVWVCPYIFSLWDSSLPIHLFALGFEFAHTSFHSGIWVCPYIFSLWDSSLPIHFLMSVKMNLFILCV